MWSFRRRDSRSGRSRALALATWGNPRENLAPEIGWWGPLVQPVVNVPTSAPENGFPLGGRPIFSATDVATNLFIGIYRRDRVEIPQRARRRQGHRRSPRVALRGSVWAGRLPCPWRGARRSGAAPGHGLPRRARGRARDAAARCRWRTAG